MITNFNELIPTQNRVRNPDKVLTKDFLQNLNGKINIAVFEDGKKYIMDGHHRCLGYWLKIKLGLIEDDSSLLKDAKYYNFNYDDFKYPNLDNRWVTPYNPLTHVRVPDLYEWKSDILQFSKNSNIDIEDYINANRNKYIQKRLVNNLSEMLDLYLRENT